MIVGIFANCTFCLKVKHLSLQQKKKLETDIKENGGKISFLSNPQCTHVISDNADSLSQYQLNCFQKKHILIANPNFIWESVKERRLLDVKKYDLNESLDVPPLPDQKASSSELKAEVLPLDSTIQEETVELTKFYMENSEILQDFEVVKYNTLEKAGADGRQEVVVVELQCSQGCPFLISAHFSVGDSLQTSKQLTVKKTSADASEYYENYIEELKKQGFLLSEHFTPQASQLASEKLKAWLLEETIGSNSLSQEVSNLVEMIWAEALGHLEHVLLKPVNKISLNDVSKAEGILLLVKSALKNGDTEEQLQKMMTEFYRLLPHKHLATEDVNLSLLANKEDLCQLIRDMVNVRETHLYKPNPPPLAKYRALRCKIEHVEQNTEEFSRISKEILQNNQSKTPVDILQIFRVGRVNEATEFLSRLGNVRPLLHGSSVRNIVGILSRGLLLPKVVEDRGIHRTDIGNLGSGIYFSDSLSTSIKYSHPGETDGSRFLIVCDVALGKCMDLFKKDFSLTEAPPGYDSVHGVSETVSDSMDFEDDEFVVYKTNQVKMKYIIKFCIPGDQIKDFHRYDNTELEEYRPEFSNILEVEDYQLPDTKPPNNVKAGLQDTSGNLVPLKDVHIKGKIIDFVAQVTVFQTYANQNHVPIEAKYVFPLDSKAAVCGFEAFINGKHIIGEARVSRAPGRGLILIHGLGRTCPLGQMSSRQEIKEKEEAQQEYREAVSQGHGAYLMDQSAPDVFTVSVGNLPPKAKVLIKITYITELSIQGPIAVFFVPATVAPWQQDKALNENLQDTVKKVYVKEIGTKQSFSLTLSIEMPYVIDFISSDTHKLKQKNTDCKAVISTMEGSSLDSNGFSLHIGLSDAYLPRMWVEKHPEKESEACMLVFQPNLEATLPGLTDKNEVVICLDCSNSMEGVTFMHAKQIALYALSLVGEEQKVNVVLFGTGYKELFSYPKYIMNNTVPEEFIKSATPAMGNTDFWKTLRYLSLLCPSQGLRSILLISDGHLQNESLTLKLVKRSVLHIRLFTCGVGSTANRHTLRSLSQCGAGVFEYFNPKSKHVWKKQIEDQMNRLQSPSCHSISVKWQQLNPDGPDPLQAPAQVPSLYHNDRLLVYGFIPHCTQATLCALIEEKEFRTMVSTTELQKTTGTMIHKLAAQALIRDFEDGILHENEINHEMKKQTMKSLIIKLSKENSLITQFTSFVAIEKRDGSESPFSNVPNVLELIAEEDVDFLPYLSWQEEQLEVIKTQPFSASSVQNEELQLESLAEVKLLLPKLKVSEDFKTRSLCLHAADQSVSLSSQLDSDGVETPLDLSSVDSLKQTGFKTQLRLRRKPAPTSSAHAATPSCRELYASSPQFVPWSPTSVLSQNSLFSSLASRNQPGAADLGLVRATPVFGPAGSGLEPTPGLGPASHGLRASTSGFGAAGFLFGPPASGLGPATPILRDAAPDLKDAASDFGAAGSGLRAATSLQWMPFPPPPPLPGGTLSSVSFSSRQFEPCIHFQGPEISPFPKISLKQDSCHWPNVFSLPTLPPPDLSADLDSHSPCNPSFTYLKNSLTSESTDYKPTPDFPKQTSSPSYRSDRSTPLDSHQDLDIVLESSDCLENSFHRLERQCLSAMPKGLNFIPSITLRKKGKKKSKVNRKVSLESDEPPARLLKTKSLERKEKCDVTSDLPLGLPSEDGGDVTCQWSWRDSVPWSAILTLQTEGGFWKLTPELGLMLNLDTDALHVFLEKKGIQSLGVKGRDCLLDLIATMLVLQLFYTRLEQEGVAVKSLMKLDDVSISRHVPWASLALKTANEWVRTVEGQYPSICQRLELGKDWASATKQLLRLQPLASTSPLHSVVLHSRG